MFSERDSFVRAILENPDDDDVRLVFADWLEENGEENYSRFIRCQIELASSKWRGYRSRSDITDERKNAVAGGCCERFADQMACDCLESVNPTYEVLRRRERELLGSHGGKWLPEPGDWTMDGTDTVVTCKKPTQKYTFRRGFVESITCDLATLLGGVCEGCYDSDDQPSGAGHANWRRSECPVCAGSGRTPGVAKAVFVAQPILQFTIVGNGSEDWPSCRCVSYGRNLVGLPSLEKLSRVK